MNQHLLTLMVLFPGLGALLQLFLPSNEKLGGKATGKWAALSTSMAASLCAVVAVVSMQKATPDLQSLETLSWVGSYAISYEMGLDGLNALMVLLVAILFPVLIAMEWSRSNNLRGMHGLFLCLQATFFGAACAQDMFLQFFFWSFSAIPFYFLIGIWGEANRERAALRSIVTASIGNGLLFTALILIYYSVEPHTFLIRELATQSLSSKTFLLFGHEIPLPQVAFALIAGGLALRAPIWPLHGWFTLVAVEAPASVLVALAAAASPIAIMIFVRLGFTLFPEILNAAAQPIVWVGITNLVLGGICALSQRGFRLLLAFLTLSEVGLVLVGLGSLNSAGLVGSIYQQLILGLSLAGFGILSGLIAQRSGHAYFKSEDGHSQLGGLATKAPAIAVAMGIVVVSLLGFPGFAGFVSHALLLLGSYTVHPLAVAVAGAALLLAAYYLFNMYRSVFLGTPGASQQSFADLSWIEKSYILPLVTCLLIFGVYPKPLLELVRPTVLTLLSTIK